MPAAPRTPEPSPPAREALRHVLILGGTTEARRLAEVLHADHSAADGSDPDGVRARGGGLRVTTSLAGRVARPVLPPGEVRTGGFGGTDGLVRWLREHHVHALVDATHPFAGTISQHAARAAAAARVPLLAVRRPGWVPGEGDDWHPVDSLEEAAALLPTLGRRVFLTTGRTGLAAFTGPEGRHGPDGLWFLVRSVDPPEGELPANAEVLLDRGPFTLDGERALLRAHRVDVLVTKDSGGAATAPKLTAAREAGLPVVVVRRPAPPEGVRAVATAEEAARWVRGG
ncbi:cobalt-precorrin-6A reductase [Streptomyces phytohabitans]|uniref:cobalt-precorrin-6A reductase n=1 Tax=Streptomyces phytohabitans TaxID=1150371 RepID=UPI00345BDD5D